MRILKDSTSPSAIQIHSAFCKILGVGEADIDDDDDVKSAQYLPCSHPLFGGL